MLADNKRIDDIEEVLVYQDSSIPNRYYYCSSRPRIVQNKMDYQIKLLHYSHLGGNDSNVGMLSFVLDLDLDDNVLNQLKKKLDYEAELIPIPWLSGNVTAMLIGGKPISFTPSLLGSNSTVISFNLNMNQYQILTRTDPDKKLVPLSVVYSLTFEAFRVAYNFKVNFDATKFRKWVQKKTKTDLLFISFEQVETFEDLKTSGVITIESVNMTGEAPPEGFKKAFLASMKKVLEPLPHFSKPTTNDSNGWSLGFSSSEVVDIQNISQQLDLNMTIAKPVLRKVFFQGTPIGLEEALKNTKDIEIPLNDNFNQKLTIRCLSNFNSQPLKAVTMRISDSSDKTIESLVFNGIKPKEQTIDLVHDPRYTDNNYQYDCTLYFDQKFAKDPLDRKPLTIERDTAFLDVQPGLFFSYRIFNIRVNNDFPWDSVSAVQLELNIDDKFSVSPKSISIDSKNKTREITAFSTEKLSFEETTYTATFIRSMDNLKFQQKGYIAGREILLNQLSKRSVKFFVTEDSDWGDCERIKIYILINQDKAQVWNKNTKQIILDKSTLVVYFDYWFAGNDREISYKIKFENKEAASQNDKAKSEDRNIQITLPFEPIN